MPDKKQPEETSRGGEGFCASGSGAVVHQARKSETGKAWKQSGQRLWQQPAHI